MSSSEGLSRGRLARNWPVLASRSDISLRYNSTPDKMLSRGKLILNMIRSTRAVLVGSMGKEMVVGIFASLGIAGGRRKLRVVVSFCSEKKWRYPVKEEISLDLMRVDLKRSAELRTMVGARM